jgi:hypothetical protein
MRTGARVRRINRPLDYNEGIMTMGRPLRHTRRGVAFRQALVVALGGTTFALLASCESAIAPTQPRAANLPTARQQSSAEDADPQATILVGTGNPSIDVPAVQAAVDHGGFVLLKGHFSFDKEPTRPVALTLSSAPPRAAYAPAAEVLVSKAVTVSGTGESDAGMTTIESGTIPFYVNAPGQRVTIRRLRFVRPISSAILVYAVRDLEIASSAIAGAVAYKNLADGIGINTSGAPPTLTTPGHPENVSGALNIVDNDIDMVGGTTADNTLGVVVFAAGTPGAAVNARVAGNTIKNTTEPAINFRRLEGYASVDHNVIRTGAVVGDPIRDHVIRVANTGLYRITDNSIDCEWPNSDAEGIGVFSSIASWPIEHVVVENNAVNMAAPSGTAFTAFSAGIGVFGFADSNVVRHNTINGRARAAISIPVFPLPPQAPAAPEDNAFIDNRFVRFAPTIADVFVGAHALRTRVVGPGTVEDEGDGTIVIQSLMTIRASTIADLDAASGLWSFANSAAGRRR